MPPAMAPPFVLLDLDDTLVDRATAIRRLFALLAARADDPDAVVARLVELDRDGRAARSLVLGQALARLGLPGEVDDLHRWYGARYPACVDPLDAVTRAALEGLRAAGTRLAVVANGDRYQEAVIRGTGVADLVDGWVISEVDGARKPDARAFRLAAARAGAAAAFPAGGWMIGDHPLDDIAAAAAAGLRTAWVARGRTWDVDAVPPDVVADDVAGAIATILEEA